MLLNLNNNDTNKSFVSFKCGRIVLHLYNCYRLILMSFFLINMSFNLLDGNCFFYGDI